MAPNSQYTARMILLVALATLVSGCGRDEPQAPAAPDKPELLIFCGAGIRPPVAEAVTTFSKQNGAKAVTDYAGSEVLLSKIRLGQHGDVYIPGDKHYIDQAAEQGMIVAREKVCYFVPTVLVQKGNPKGVKGLRDLIQPGLKLGLGDSRACAIGRKSRAIFEKNRIPWQQVEKGLRYQSLTVNELGIQIQSQSLDAVIVWDAIAAYYAKVGEQVPIPVEQNIVSTVEAGVLKFTKHRDLAEKFIQFLASDSGERVFKKHNYRTEPPR